MRFFLYTYATRKNWDESKRTCVFGTWKDRTGLATKVQRLKRGDLIVIRNGECRHELKCFGAGRVFGDVFDQERFSPYRDLLWKDEVEAGKVLYPMRVPVDFKGGPAVQLDRITWASLDGLGFRNAKGVPLKGAQSWAKKFSGNFLDAGQETERFAELIEMHAG